MGKVALLKPFLPLLQDLPDVRFYVLTSGRFGLKSFNASLAVMTLVNNLKHRVFYARYTYQSAKNTIISEVQEKINILGLTDFYHTTQNEISEKDEIYKSRSRLNPNEKQRKITFGGIKTSSGNQTAKLKGLKDYTIFVLDEAQEGDKETEFDSLQLSIRAGDLPNKIILILNPTDKRHWIYKRFFEHAGVNEGFSGVVGSTCYIHTSYLDALHLVPKSILDEINYLKNSDIEKYNHLILGRWLDKVEGQIIRNWRYGDFDESLPWLYGMDFGYFPDPDVLVKVAVDNKNKKIYAKEVFRMTEASEAECIAKVQNFEKKAIVADSSAKRLINGLRKIGFNIIDSIKYPNSVEDGVKLLLSYEIIVTHESKDLGNECNLYHRKNGNIVSLYDHGIDCIRYVAQYLNNPDKTRSSKVVGVKARL